jgi:hypothetical protein
LTLPGAGTRTDVIQIVLQETATENAARFVRSLGPGGEPQAVQQNINTRLRVTGVQGVNEGGGTVASPGAVRLASVEMDTTEITEITDLRTYVLRNSGTITTSLGDYTADTWTSISAFTNLMTNALSLLTTRVNVNTATNGKLKETVQPSAGSNLTLDADELNLGAGRALVAEDVTADTVTADDVTADTVTADAFKFTLDAPVGSGLRLQYVPGDGEEPPDRFALLSNADTNPTTGLHVARLLVGADAAEDSPVRSWLTEDLVPKAWGLAHVDNTVPGTPVTTSGGRKYNAVAVVVTWSPYTPGGGGSSEHRWQVTGLDMANTQYSVVASISVDLDSADHVFETGAAGDGMTYGVMVVGKVADGFYLVPYSRDSTGARVALVASALNTDIASYTISFQVFGNGTPLV